MIQKINISKLIVLRLNKDITNQITTQHEEIALQAEKLKQVHKGIAFINQSLENLIQEKTSIIIKRKNRVFCLYVCSKIYGRLLATRIRLNQYDRR